MLSYVMFPFGFDLSLRDHTVDGRQREEPWSGSGNLKSATFSPFPGELCDRTNGKGMFNTAYITPPGVTISRRWDSAPQPIPCEIAINAGERLFCMMEVYPTLRVFRPLRI